MKKQITLIMLAALLMSCGSDEKKASSENVSIENADKINANNKIETETKSRDGRTTLCKIDGEDWGYTTASGIVFIEKTNGKRTAIFTFKNRLEKGSESMQVEYLVDEQKISRIIVDKKWVDLNGKMSGTLYCLLREKNNYSGYLQNKGTVEVRDGLGSGTAQFVAENQFEKKEYDQKYHYIEITDLKFKKVGYSDLDEAKKKLESFTGKGK